MAQLPLVLVYHGPENYLPPFGSRAIYFHHCVDTVDVSEIRLSPVDTVDGSEIRRSPPGMYKTLKIVRYLPYQLVIAGFLPTTV